MFIDTPAKIAILGGGPIGLEAALYARYLGYEVEIFERGRVCENVLRWGHVRMFSPFGMNSSPLALAALAAQDDAFDPPAADELLTGREWVQRYLLPLAQSDLLIDGLRERAEVISVGRENCLKGDYVGDAQRVELPLRILVQDDAGVEHFAVADAVIDTTGVFANPNWLGDGGIPAAGEGAAAAHVEYGLPDVLSAQRESYAGKSTLVIGGGYSAATSVVALAKLAREAAGTSVTWITRHTFEEELGGPIPRIPNDRLAARDELARSANDLASQNPKSQIPNPKSPVTHWPGTTVDAISLDPASGRFTVRLIGEHAGEHAFDRVIANVGYRPDATIYDELQVHQCYASEGPMKLAAALLGQSSADCLAQQSCGPNSLVTSEPNFYILGSKSYGRNSQFLFSIGLAQIRELFTLIAGRENLDLYATMKPK
jgi:hypothetical protein